MRSSYAVALWLGKYAGGGLLSWITPRFLVAIGVPLDRWIAAMAGWAVHLDREAALWTASFLVAVLLYSGSVYLSKDHDWRPAIPGAVKRLGARVDPVHVIILGLLIALGGAIWMWRVTPSIAALQSTITAQGNEIERLKLERITAVKALPPAVSNAPSPGQLTTVAVAPPMDLAMKIARKEQLQSAIVDVKRQREVGETTFEKLTKQMQSKPPREPNAEEIARVPMAKGNYDFMMMERGNLRQMHESQIHQFLRNIKALHDKLYEGPFEIITTAGIEQNPHRQVPGEEQIEDKVQGYEYRKAYYVWQNGKRLTDSLIRRMETEAEALNRDIQRVDTRPVAEKGK